MPEPTAEGAGARAPAPASSFGRLAGVFLSPTATFRSIAERPTWGLALVVLVLVYAGSTAVLMSKVDGSEMREQMRQQMIDQGQKPTEEQLDQYAKLGVGCGVATIVVLPLAICVLGGLLFWGLFNFFGGQLNFPASLSVMAHGVMPAALLSLLSALVGLTRGSIPLEELQRGGSLLPSNLSFLAPEDAGRGLAVLLASVDLFNLWSLVLLGLGYHLVARVSRVWATAVVAVLWLAFVGIMAGLASLGGG